MARKIRPDAFNFYISLGAERSYQKVADRYGVTKRAVVKVASKEKWQSRIHSVEESARQTAEKKAGESLADMSDRHIKCLKLMQRKALEALRSLPIATAMEAVRTLDLTIKQERLIRGEPGDRHELTVESKIRSEYGRWLSDDGDGNGNEDKVLTNVDRDEDS